MSVVDRSDAVAGQAELRKVRPKDQDGAVIGIVTLVDNCKEPALNFRFPILHSPVISYTMIELAHNVKGIMASKKAGSMWLHEIRYRARCKVVGGFDPSYCIGFF